MTILSGNGHTRQALGLKKINSGRVYSTVNKAFALQFDHIWSASLPGVISEGLGNWGHWSKLYSGKMWKIIKIVEKEIEQINNK